MSNEKPPAMSGLVQLVPTGFKVKKVSPECPGIRSLAEFFDLVNSKDSRGNPMVEVEVVVASK
jgi:hypothetical protein